MRRIRATITTLYCATAVAAVVSAPVLAGKPTYIAPVASVSAMAITVTVVNYTPFYDDVFALDVAVIDMSTGFSDDAFIPDQINTFAVNKVLTDATSVIDSAAKFIQSPFDRNKGTGTVDPDPAVITDTLAKTFARPNVADSAIVSQSIAKHMQPAVPDAIVSTDLINFFDVQKVEGDSPFALDELAVNLSRPDVTDIALATDDPAKALSRPNVADAAGATDALVKTIGDVITDTFAVTDAAPVFNATSVLQDAAPIADTNIAFNASHVEADAAAVDDVFSFSLILGVVSRVLDGGPFNRTGFN